MNQPEFTWIWVIFKVNFHFFFSHIRKRSDLEARLRRFFAKLSNFCSKWNSQQRTIHPPQIDQFFTDRFNSQQNSREFQQTKRPWVTWAQQPKLKTPPQKKKKIAEILRQNSPDNKYDGRRNYSFVESSKEIVRDSTSQRNALFCERKMKEKESEGQALETFNYEVNWQGECGVSLYTLLAVKHRACFWN